MRSIAFIALLLLFTGTAMAQDEKKDKEKKKKREPVDKIIIDLTHDRWTKDPIGIKIKPWSIGTSVNLFFDYPFGSSPLGFAWGAGLMSHNIHSDGAVVYKINPDGSTFTSFDKITADYRISKLVLNYLYIPAEFRLRTAKKPAFRLFLGGRIGYLIGSHTKFVDDNTKVKVYRIKNIDPLMYGVTARIGVGRIQLTGFYGLNSIFKKGKGEAGIIPYSVGVNIMPFVK
jgi:hypothetical protein